MCLKINWATHQWRYIYILHVCIMYTDLSSDISSKASEPGPGRRGGGSLSLPPPPTFLVKLYIFCLLLRFVISPVSTSLPTPLFTTIQNWPQNGLIRIRETRDFKLTLFFVLRYLLVHVPVYENISHVYLLHCSIYIHVSTSVHNLYLDLKYIDIA